MAAVGMTCVRAAALIGAGLVGCAAMAHAQNSRVPARVIAEARTTTLRDSISVWTMTGAINKPLVANFTLPKNQFIKLPSPLTDSASTSTYYARAPIRYVGPAADNRMLNLQLEARPEGGGLMMSDDGSQYSTRLSVVLHDLDNLGRKTRLASTNTLRFWASHARFDPQLLEVNRANDFQSIVTTSREPPDTLTLEVTMTVPLDTTRVLVPVLKPAVLVEAPRSIPGLGMGTAKLNVGLPANAGTRSRTVRMSPNLGSLSSQNVELTASTAREVQLRSRGLGVDTIRVATSQLRDATVLIEYAFPLGLLVSAGLGSPLGALATTLRRRGTKKRGAGGATWLASVIAGLVVVALYTIGVNVFPLDIPLLQNEVAVFAVGALGGFGGVAVLEKVVGGAT